MEPTTAMRTDGDEAPWSSPWFERGRRGGGLATFDEASPGDWTPTRLALWCGWLAGKRWTTLARLIDAGWMPPAAARLFPDAKAADALVRAALGGPGRAALFVLSRPAHARGLLALAPGEYKITHPMRRAVHQRCADLLVALVNAGAAPDLACPGLPGNPLNHAAAIGWDDGARILIGAGADPNARDDQGRCALWMAAGQGRCATLRELVACGARPEIARRHGVGLLAGVLKQRDTGRGAALEHTVATLLDIGTPIELPPGGRGTQAVQRWMARHELKDLARRGAAMLLERELPAGSASQANGRL